MVPRENVIIGVPNETCVALDADHVHMTRFDDSTDEIYQLIVESMRGIRETEPKRLAEVGKACTCPRCDDLMLKLSGLVKDDQPLTFHPEGM